MLIHQVRKALGASRFTTVGLSGGVDSVVLLRAAVEAGLEVSAVHVDHGLRPESGEDATFCAHLCRDLGVPFELVRIHVAKGNSTQGRARTQRYAALVRAAARLGCDRIATAHHADDALESAWLQHMRGSGPVGLQGPRRTGDWMGFEVVRPLLDVRREEILEFAEARGLEWREDPSNLDPKYARTSVRAALADIEPQANMDGLRRDAAELEAAVSTLRERAAVRISPLESWFRRDCLAQAESDAFAAWLLASASELNGGLSREMVEAVSAAVADSQTEARRFCGHRVVVEVARDSVTLSATRGQGTRLLDAREAAPVQWTPVDGDLRWFDHWLSVRTGDEREGRAGSPPSGAEDVVLGVRSALVRGPRAGDRIEGHLVHDLLARARVPPAQRWSWPTLWYDHRCLWVAGISTAASDGKILLPHDAKSGIFVSWQRFPFESRR